MRVTPTHQTVLSSVARVLSRTCSLVSVLHKDLGIRRKSSFCRRAMLKKILGPSGLSFPACHREICRSVDNHSQSVGERRGDARAGPSCCCCSAFGPVPSRLEVQNAVSDLQKMIAPTSGRNAYDSSNHTLLPTRIMNGIYSPGQESTWHQFMSRFYDPNIFHSHGFLRVNDAFRLLQEDPSVQKMVVSLSSDKAVWNAIINNEAVRELCTPHFTEEGRPQSSDEESDPATNILRWLLGMTRKTVMELIWRFVLLMNDLLRLPGSGKPVAQTKELEEKLASSVLLSIVILLIVVVTRLQQAGSP